MSIHKRVINFFLNKNFVEKIIILFGFFGSLFVLVAKVYEFNHGCLSACEEQVLMNLYLVFFGLILLGFCLYLQISLNIWSLELKNNNKKTMMNVVVSVVGGLCLSVAANYSYNKISDIFDNTQHIKSLVLKIYEGKSSNLDSLEGSIEEKNKESINSAEMMFKLSGALTEVIDHQGHRVMFEPSPQDLKNRQSIEVIESRMQSLRDLLKLAVIGSWVLFLGSIVAGVVARRFYKNRAS